MKIYVLSDLHLEFSNFSSTETGADVVVLAGDIDLGIAGADWAAAVFPDIPVIYVPGNHEYYGGDIKFRSGMWEDVADNVHILDNGSIEIESVRFLGCTLWTDFKLFGDGDDWFAMQRAKQSIEDFASIKYGDRLFTPQHSVLLHEESKAWLKVELQQEFQGPTVVVTHHLPATKSVAPRYATDPLSLSFASKCERLIEEYEPELWIHGHTHVPCDYELYETRVVCNPRGYPGERNEPAFDGGLLIRV